MVAFEAPAAMRRTPGFEIDQNDENVVIHINAPYIRMSSAEILLDGREFSFFCRPFSLKLNLTGDVVSDVNCRCLYDPFEVCDLHTC